MKIFLPPIHIKLELIKCLVKAMAKTSLIDTERAAWERLKWVFSNSLGRKIRVSPDFSDGIQTLPNACKEMGRCMSLEVPFLHSHLDFLPEIIGEVSDEQGGRFHQDIKSIEHRCPGFWKDSMMTDVVP
jgi:hypothetical protein